MDMVPFLEMQVRTFAFTSAPSLLCLAFALAFSLSTALIAIGSLVTHGIGEEEEWGLDGAQPATRLDIFELGVTRTMLVLKIK
jgi:hypothetical protein